MSEKEEKKESTAFLLIKTLLWLGMAGWGVYLFLTA